MSAAAVDELLAEARALGYGSEQVHKCEEAVRVADEQKDLDKAFEARFELVQAGVFGGAPEKSFVAFGWCASKCDEDPDRFPESRAVGGVFLMAVDLLWAYKWMTLQVPWYPQLSRAQIESTLDDMETRYAKHGLSLRPVYMQRARACLEMGDDVERAKAWFRKWQWAKLDAYADCRACEQNFEVEHHLDTGNPTLAMRAAEPLLSGELSCAEVPHITFGALLLPLYDQGETERAGKLATRGYEMIRDNPDHLSAVARHVDYLVVSGQLGEARAMAERHAPWAHSCRLLERRFTFLLCLRHLLEHDASETALALPDGMGEGATFAAQKAWLDDEVRTNAQRFDERNGNDLYARRIASHPRPPSR